MKPCLAEGGYVGRTTYESCSPIHSSGTLDKLDACATAYVGWMQNQKPL
jgi:hypothetical protein